MALSAILLFSTISLYSQIDFHPGYYIINEQDTVYGEIDNRGDLKNGNICVFRQNDNTESIEFKPGEILAYRFLQGKYYTSIILPVDGETSLVFAEFLVNGVSDLLYHRSINTDHYYIETKQGEWMELSNDDIFLKKNGVNYKRNSNLYIGLLKANFMECSEIQEQIEETKFTHISLIEVASQYHDYVCEEGEECIIYETIPKKVKLSIAPTLGFALNKLAVPGHPDYKNHSFDNSKDMAFGLQLMATLPRLNNKLSLLLMTEYSESYFFSTYTSTLGSYLTDYSDAHVHRKYLSVMLGIQYVYPKGKIRPSFAVGPDFGYSLELSFKEISERVSTSEVRAYETNGGIPSDLAFGAFAQTGLEFFLNSKQRIILQLRYHFTAGTNELTMERGESEISYGTYPIHLQGFTINVGYFFF